MRSTGSWRVGVLRLVHGAVLPSSRANPEALHDTLGHHLGETELELDELQRKGFYAKKGLFK